MNGVRQAARELNDILLNTDRAVAHIARLTQEGTDQNAEDAKTAILALRQYHLRDLADAWRREVATQKARAEAIPLRQKLREAGKSEQDLRNFDYWWQEEDHTPAEAFAIVMEGESEGYGVQ